MKIALLKKSGGADHLILYIVFTFPFLPWSYIFWNLRFAPASSLCKEINISQFWAKSGSVLSSITSIIKVIVEITARVCITACKVGPRSLFCSGKQMLATAIGNDENEENPHQDVKPFTKVTHSPKLWKEFLSEPENWTTKPEGNVCFYLTLRDLGKNQIIRKWVI